MCFWKRPKGFFFLVKDNTLLLSAGLFSLVMAYMILTTSTVHLLAPSRQNKFYSLSCQFPVFSQKKVCQQFFYSDKEKS